MIFKIFSTKKLAKILALKAQTIDGFCKNWLLGFEKSAIFCRKLAKIAENCDPRISTEIAPLETGLRALVFGEHNFS
jgi:hypothetical protein